MATSGTRMSYNSSNFYQPQNVKFATLPHGSSIKDGDLTFEMHRKMSKKIAQLTKVIYTLNTKKDEHENMVQHLKDQYKEDMEKLGSQMRTKLLQYKEKLSEAQGHNDRLVELEKLVGAQQDQHKKREEDFTDFQAEMAERLHQTEITYRRKLWEFSGEMLEEKKHFQEKMKNFDKSEKELKDKHHSVIEELHRHYQEEIKNLLDVKNIKENERITSNQQLTYYQGECQHWKSKVLDLENELKDSSAEWEKKFQEMRESHEEEMSRITQEKDKKLEENIETWKTDRENLRRELGSDFSEKVEELNNEIAQIRKQCELYKSKSEELQKELEDRDGSATSLSTKLEESKNALYDEQSLCKFLQEESISKDATIKRQKENVLKLSAMVSDLEASRVQRETEIQSLREKLDEYQNAVTDLGTVKMKLQVQEELIDVKSNEIVTLKKNLMDLNTAKTLAECHSDEEFQKIKVLYEEEKMELLKQKEEEITLVKEADKEHLMKIQNNMLDKFQLQKEEFDKEIQHLKQHNKSVVEEFEKIGQELKSQLTNAEEKLQNFQDMVRNSEENLSSASTHINTLKEGATRLKEELDACRVELRSTKQTNSQLQTELVKKQAEHETELMKCEAANQKNLKTVCEGLESKNKESLRLECSRARDEVALQMEEDKRRSLEQLSRDKDAEIKAATKGWEFKVTELQQEIFSLQNQLKNITSQCSIQIEEEKARFKLIENQYETEKGSFQEKLQFEAERLTELHKIAIKEMQNIHLKEIQELEKQLKIEHNTAMHSVQLANDAARQTLEEKHRQDLLQNEENLIKQYERNIELLQEDLYKKHRMEMSSQMEIHMKEISRLKEQLENLLQTSKQKERDHYKTMSELEERIERHEKHVASIELENKKLNEFIEKLMGDIEKQKSHHIQMQENFNLETLQLKDQMETARKREMENAEANYVGEMKKIVAEFSKSKELMSNTISTLTNDLKKVEEKFKNRESRPEDLEEIHKLRDEIYGKELQMKKVQDEKHFFQMELINRDTNFNKIFGSSLQVGLINPLKVKTRSDPPNRKFIPPAGHTQNLPAAATAATITNNSPTGQQNQGRLQHLPGSPLHDERLNPVPPLPPKYFKK
ncbi:protein FAM184A-like [Argonauta hians]